MSVGQMLRKGTTALLVLGLVLSIMLWGASYFFSIAILSDKATMWEIAKGCVGVGRSIPPPVVFHGGPEAAGGIGAKSIYGMSTIHRFWKSRAFDGWETIWTPKLKLKPLRIVIPLWIPALLFLTLTWRTISPACGRPWRIARKRSRTTSSLTNWPMLTCTMAGGDPSKIPSRQRTLWRGVGELTGHWKSELNLARNAKGISR